MSPCSRRSGSSALDDALDALEGAAGRLPARSLKRGARRLLEEPSLLELIAPGLGDSDSAAAERLVRSQKDIMRALGRIGHPAYDPNRLLSLRQAYVALRLTRLRRSAIDLSDDAALPGLLEERKSLSDALDSAIARIADIDAQIGRSMGEYRRGFLPGWIIRRRLEPVPYPRQSALACERTAPGG